MIRVNNFKKFVGAAMTAVVLAAGMFIGGCSDSSNPADTTEPPPSSVIPDSAFTLADLENANSQENVFSEYAAVRVGGDYYGHIMEWDEPTDFNYVYTFVKGQGGLNYYEEYDIPSFKVSIEYDGSVYYEDTNGVYGVYGFFDDGAFEEYLLPHIQPQTVAYRSYGGVITSVETRDGVRYVTLRENLSDMGGLEMWWFGIDGGNGNFDTELALDPNTNLVRGYKEYLIEDGKEPRLTGDITVTYFAENNFTLPEYVIRAKDMSVTRTVRVVLNVGDSDEGAFSFTLPKGAGFVPYALERYGSFLDAELTVRYDPYVFVEEHPDEMTVYMVRRSEEVDSSVGKYVLENTGRMSRVSPLRR